MQINNFLYLILVDLKKKNVKFPHFPTLLAEHYVFPDDRLLEDQHEVRTVEEECLFCVAYPELVESYMRDKAQAEENKAKSKS